MSKLHGRGWIAAALALAFLPASAFAQRNEVRIAQQFGLSYLPLHVATEQKLIEREAAALGMADAKVTIATLGSGAAVNDAMISGNIDVAMAGLTVLINLWDKTVGRNAVKGMMAIADTPIVFNTIDPRIKSIRDFQDSDRIAMTAARGTQHHMALQMAAAREFGWEQRTRFDALAISMPHPDAVVALLSGGAQIRTHATTVPFHNMELEDPRVRTILNSYDLVGGRHTLIVAYNTEKWRQDNPKLYAATYAGLAKAMEVIRSDRRAAAELYLRVEKSRLTADQIVKMLSDDNMLTFTPQPNKVMNWADYMMKSGAIKNRMESWKDVFFEELHALPGS
ncbi:MAG: ABC transporter substrate-binding protein [Alphaproteobacteria bacterium]|nr:ABC transporter substrate-binding protein [Alphaproteobacteria bacterium]